jgi:hypothetical protein
MSAASRRKGNRAEVAVVAALKRLGVAAMTTRYATGGRQYGDDVISDLPVSLEVKDHSRDGLPGWLDQARSQADDCFAAVVHKRRGRADAGEWFVTMQLDEFVRLVRPDLEF